MQPEKKSYRDGMSGVEVTQLTDYRGHSHHFYFTNPGWYAEGRKLLFSSDRNNRTNLFGIDIAAGEIEQLTDLEPVPLPRELEFLTASKKRLSAARTLKRSMAILFSAQVTWLSPAQ